MDLDSAFAVPTLSTELLFDGHMSQFFLGNVTASGDAQVKFAALASLQFSLIRSVQSYGSYYHLWSGYEDGSFLGYYAKGQMDKAPPNVFGISYMRNANHSCVAAYDVPKPCRESFAAKPSTGAKGVSVGAADYDCRERGKSSYQLICAVVNTLGFFLLLQQQTELRNSPLIFPFFSSFDRTDC